MKSSTCLIIVVFILQLTGCSSIGTKAADQSKAYGGFGVVYAGTRTNFDLFGWYFNCVSKEPVMLFLSPLMIPVVIDIPLSFVADTILLPIDLANYRSSDDKKERTRATNGEEGIKKCHFHI